jgi:hypothetical protein
MIEKQRKELLDMEAVEAYYDGRVFIPKKPVTAKKNQNALVILDTINMDTDDYTLPKISRTKIKEMMKGSITESLIGIISDPNITLEEIRTERLSKYERTD